MFWRVCLVLSDLGWLEGIDYVVVVFFVLDWCFFVDDFYVYFYFDFVWVGIDIDEVVFDGIVVVEVDDSGDVGGWNVGKGVMYDWIDVEFIFVWEFDLFYLVVCYVVWVDGVFIEIDCVVWSIVVVE